MSEGNTARSRLTLSQGGPPLSLLLVSPRIHIKPSLAPSFAREAARSHVQCTCGRSCLSSPVDGASECHEPVVRYAVVVRPPDYGRPQVCLWVHGGILGQLVPAVNTSKKSKCSLSRPLRRERGASFCPFLTTDLRPACSHLVSASFPSILPEWSTHDG